MTPENAIHSFSGQRIIEKTYNRDFIQKDHEIYNFAFQVKADRKSLKKRRTLSKYRWEFFA